MRKPFHFVLLLFFFLPVLPPVCNFIPKPPAKSSWDFCGHAAGNHQEGGEGWFSICASAVLPRKKLP